jgi:hypothetical protein
MNRQFADVGTMHRLSYSGLDRRVIDHERRITDLESR